MDKWAAITIVYNEIDFIKGWVESKRDLGFDDSDMLVMVSEKPFFGKEYPSDGTVEYLEDEGIPYIAGTWFRDDPMLNAGLTFLKDYDWVLYQSPDEYLTCAGFAQLKEHCKNGNKPAYAIRTMNTYFKSHKLRIEPREMYEPIIAISPKQTKFRDIRSVPYDDYGFFPTDIILYHFAYYRPDYKVKQKMISYAHAPQILKNCYEEVRLRWTPETTNFHPTHPEQYKGVILDEPPKEITKYLHSHSLFTDK